MQVSAANYSLDPSLLQNAQHLQTSAPTSAASTPEQVESVGEEFESLFLSLLLKEMRTSDEEGLFGDESSDSYGGLFDMFMGQHLASQSPLGIQKMMAEQYEKMGKSLVTTEAPEV